MSELSTITCESLKFMIYKVSSSSREKLIDFIINDENGTKSNYEKQKITKQNWTTGSDDKFLDILKEYVLDDLIQSIFELSNIKLCLDNAWYHVYEDKDDYHHFHLHQNVFMSSVLYLELSDKDSITQFVDPINGKLVQPMVDEGEGILFSPNVFHRSPQNIKAERKIIISFNLSK